MKYRIMIAVSAVSLVSIAVLASVVAGEKDKGESKTQIEDVPAAVQAAIKKATQGAKVQEIEKETEDGKTVYEVEISKNGLEIDLVFDEKGGLVAFDVEGDDEDDAGDDEDDDDKGEQREEEEENDGEEDDAEVVPFAKIPAAAQKALLKLAGDAKISEVDVEDEDGVKVYEGAWKVNGVEHEAEVTANGDVIETEQVIAAGDAPKAVQKAAAKAFPKGAKVTIEKKTVVLYEIEAEIKGKEKEILVAATGQRVEIEHGDDDDDHGDDDDDDHEAED